MSRLWHVLHFDARITACGLYQNHFQNLNIIFGENDFVTSNKYLPGAYSLGEIHESGGYTNELLIGSEAVFSGRKYYYEKHGNYIIRDFDYFVENGLFDYDTRVWWGIVDRYLFQYAKDDLLE